MGSTLNGNYVYVNGYGDDGELIAAVGAPFAALDDMQTVAGQLVVRSKRNVECSSHRRGCQC